MADTTLPSEGDDQALAAMMRTIADDPDDLVPEEKEKVLGALADLTKDAMVRYRQMAFDEHLQRRPVPNYDEFASFIASLSPESDRAVPVIFLAFIDAQIESMLAAELNPNIPGGVQKLLSPDGLFGSFGARIYLCQSIGWISDMAASDLHLLRKIRNEFSHKAKIGFDTEPIPGLLSSLNCLSVLLSVARETKHAAYLETGRDKLWRLVIDGQFHDIQRTRRLDFTMAAAWTLHHAALELYLAPMTQRFGFGHRGVDGAMNEQPLFAKRVGMEQGVGASGDGR